MRRLPLIFVTRSKPNSESVGLADVGSRTSEHKRSTLPSAVMSTAERPNVWLLDECRPNVCLRGACLTASTYLLSDSVWSLIECRPNVCLRGACLTASTYLLSDSIWSLMECRPNFCLHDAGCAGLSPLLTTRTRSDWQRALSAAWSR
ncbi:hypothetical protein BpHYR1_023841 [Brachionus plicatilis]|uniref:Uncharacterized protein n=1 Tax=Brachionus plicatilis TaxID=10195 RepID=A0A3M7S4R3_BRAPC|nr:hypothetical protein BpHYR1_023841 [Brachionus plicatilis]